MTNSSNPSRDGFPARRRTMLLLAAGSVAGLIPRSGRAGIEPPSAATAPPVSAGRPELPDLSGLGQAHQVMAISCRDQTFSVTTRDGQTTEFGESNLRFKIDSSGAGPLPGAPVIMPAGRMGDRSSVFFASPGEISTFVKHEF